MFCAVSMGGQGGGSWDNLLIFWPEPFNIAAIKTRAQPFEIIPGVMQRFFSEKPRVNL